MGTEVPSGGRPDPRRAALRRAQRLVRLAALAALGAVVAAEEEARRRWPSARARIVAAYARLERAARGGVARLRPRLRRAAAKARRRVPSRRTTVHIALGVLVVCWVLWERCGVSGCPDVGRLASYQPGGASVLVDRSGEPFAHLAPLEHAVVPLDSLPAYVAHAFIAVEDKRFYEHDGVDWWRVLGALLADVRAGGFVEGSSTIPMQLSRTLFPDRIRVEEKTLRRKLLEVRVAREIEDRFTKEEILELYLNHVYLGGGAYGVEAASRHYFGKRASELALEEAALLAALPKAPAHYDPWRRPEAAQARRDLVLELMERQDRVAFEDAEDARGREIDVVRESDRDRDGDVLAPYFAQHVRRLLEDELGEDLYAAPLRIVTTLDSRAQEAAEEELAAQLRAVERGAFGRLYGPRYGGRAEPGADGTDELQGAAVIMDARTGDVLAWVGGRDFDRSRFDRARLARRQAGSAFKPFVYAAALEAGFAPSQPILDAPFRVAPDGGREWEPQNYGGRFEGRMSMREALVRSQNVPAVRLAAAVGDDRVADFARRAGFTGDVPASPVAALGVTAVSPLEMTMAYSAFAGRGTRVEPRFVLRVEDPDGRVLWEREPERAPVTRPEVAFILTDMLRDVVDHGTGTGVWRAGFRGPAAGKTGTTNDAADVWFVGYTPELVGTVWIGFDRVRPLPARATGGAVAAPVWGRIMARVYRGRPAPRWGEAPPEVVARRVDPRTGLALAVGCRPRRGGARQELFLEGREPEEACPRHEDEDLFDRLAGWFGSVFGPDGGEPWLHGEPDPALGVPRLPLRGETHGDARERERDRGREAWRGPYERRGPW